LAAPWGESVKDADTFSRLIGDVQVQFTTRRENVWSGLINDQPAEIFEIERPVNLIIPKIRAIAAAVPILIVVHQEDGTMTIGTPLPMGFIRAIFLNPVVSIRVYI
jgi:hypothetical protein